MNSSDYNKHLAANDACDREALRQTPRPLG